jgi:hypothetical protein
VGRFLSVTGIGLLVFWVVANLLDLGPVRDVAGTAMTWAVGLTGLSAVIAAVSVLVCGLMMGRTSPAWLRFVQHARTAATVIGCGLILVGLLHYRDTEPHGEISWLVLGLAVLAGAGAVHGWLLFTERRNLA